MRKRWCLVLSTVLVVFLSALPAARAEKLLDAAFDGIGIGEDKATSPSPGAEADASWKEALSEDELRDLYTLGLKLDTLGKAEKATRSGFDPYDDTPNFKNFTGMLTRAGNCTGLSFLSKVMYMHVTFLPGQPSKGDEVEEMAKLLSSPILTGKKIHGASNFRDLCVKNPKLEGRLKTTAQFGQLRNINPNSLRAIAQGWTGIKNDGGTVRQVRLRARAGAPTLMGATGNGPGVGHSLLAYKVLDFEKATLVYVYDCNSVYKRAEGTHRRTLLFLDREKNEMRLYPAAYDARYGGKLTRIMCADGAADVIVARARETVTEKIAPALESAGVKVGRTVMDKGSIIGGLARTSLGGVSGFFLPWIVDAVKGD